jgi:hypothetical protein
MRIEIFAVTGMTAAKPQGDQVFDGLAEELDLRVTKKLGGTRIRATDYTLGVGDKDGVWRDIKKVLQGGLSELGPYVLSRSRCVWFRRISRTHR